VNNSNNALKACILYCSLKRLGCFNQTLGQIWTNQNVGLRIVIKKLNPMAGFVHI